MLYIIVERGIFMEYVYKNDSDFSQKLENNRQEAVMTLREKVEFVKINAIKEFFKQNNIVLDISDKTDIKDVNKFLKNNLEPDLYNMAMQYEKKFDDDLKDVIKDLEDGSQTAFTKFVSGLKSALNITLNVGAFAGIHALFSNPVAKVISGFAVIAPNVYKAIKNYGEINEKSKSKSIDVMLMKLSSDKDNDGKITNISLPENVMSNVKSFLENKHLNVRTTDTITFLSDIYELKPDVKKEILEIVNSLMGNRFDVKEELKKNEKTIKKYSNDIKDKVITPLSTAALVGANMAVGLNSVSKDLTTLVASGMTGLVTAATTGSVTKGLVASGAQFGLRQGAKFIPVDGIREVVTEKMDTLASLETTGALAGGMMAITGVKLAGQGIKYVAQKAINGNKSEKEEKEYNELMRDRIIQDINNNPNREVIEKENNKEIIRQLLVDELSARGLEIPVNASLSEIKMIIKSSSDNDKKQTLDFLNNIKKIEEQDTATFKDRIFKFAETSLQFTKIGLAAIGVYNLVNPGAFDNLKVNIDKRLQVEKDKLDLKITDRNGKVDELEGKIEYGPERVNLIKDGEIYHLLERQFEDPTAIIEKARFFGEKEIPKKLYAEMIKGEKSLSQLIEEYRMPEDLIGKNIASIISNTKLTPKELFGVIKSKNNDLYDSLVKSGCFKESSGILFTYKPESVTFDLDQIKDLSEIENILGGKKITSSEELEKAIYKLVDVDDVLSSNNLQFEDESIEFLRQHISKNGKIDYSFIEVNNELKDKGYEDIYDFVNKFVYKKISMEDVYAELEKLKISGDTEKYEALKNEIERIKNDTEIPRYTELVATHFNVGDNINGLNQNMSEIIALTQNIDSLNAARELSNSPLNFVAENPTSMFGFGAIVSGIKGLINKFTNSDKNKDEKKEESKENKKNKEIEEVEIQI